MATTDTLKEAGFNPKPYATTLEESSTLRADQNAPLNVRSAGWCSDWPSGSSWFPPLFQSTNLKEEGLGSNYAVFSEPSIDKRIDEILSLPLTEQPAAWNELDVQIAEGVKVRMIKSTITDVIARGEPIKGAKKGDEVEEEVDEDAPALPPPPTPDVKRGGGFGGLFGKK